MSFNLLNRRIEYVRQKIRLTDVMKHFGHRYRLHGNMLCPFHEEENPSARLYADQDTFWCWVCSPNHGVDVVEYVILALGIEEDVKAHLHQKGRDLDKAHSIATLRGLEYLEQEFNLGFLSEPWEQRLMDALRREAPREDPERYWRDSHIQILRILNLHRPAPAEAFWNYAHGIARLFPLRKSPVSEQRPLWTELRQAIAAGQPTHAPAV